MQLLNLPRTTEAVEHVYGEFEDREFRVWCEENGEDYDYIMEFSSRFGTEMHSWCLEGKRPEKMTPLHIACYQQWVNAVREYKIKLIETETDLIFYSDGKPILSGTRDAIAELLAPKEKMKGTCQLDLKFYACWRGPDYEYKEPHSSKLSKANLQTYIYGQAEDKYKDAPRAVLHLTPTGFGLYPFKRRPLKQYQQAMAFCEDQYKLHSY